MLHCGVSLMKSLFLVKCNQNDYFIRTEFKYIILNNITLITFKNMLKRDGNNAILISYLFELRY